MSLVTLMGAAGVGLIAAPAAGAHGPPGGTLYVNGSTGVDVNNCRISSAPCKTINYAISQSAVGSQIDVAPGIYDEQVVISGAGHDGLVIDGSGQGNGGTTIDPSALPSSDTDTDSSQLQYAIVDVTGASNVTLENLTINGNNAQSTFNSCTNDFVGAYYHDAGGSLTNVEVTEVDLPTADFGCQDGLGVYVASDSGDISNVIMTSDFVHVFDKNGITCDDPGTTCSISKSTVIGDGPINTIAQNDYQIYGANATMTSDSASGVSYTGGGTTATAVLVINAGTFSMTKSTMTSSDTGAYLLEDAAFNLQGGTTEGQWTVSKNTVNGEVNHGGGPAGNGFGDGIDVDSTTAPVSVDHNKVESNAGFGISLYGAAGATVSKNTVNSNLNGIFLGAGSVAATASGSTISSNKVAGNTNDGILAQSSTSGNTFSSNKLDTNSNWDAQDQSTGSGTSGTANTWTGNHCMPGADDTPLGLC
jgi:parallel beta-helix repeat protein